MTDSTSTLSEAAIEDGLQRARDLWESDPEGCLAELRKLGDAAPDDVRVLAALGTVLLGRQKPVEAMPVLRKWVAAEPDNAVAHYHQGLAFAGLGDAWQAVEAQRRALAKAPGFGEAAFELARLLAESPNSDEALAACQESGRQLFEARRFEDAAALLARSLEMDGNQPDAAYQLGQCFLELGKLDEAQQAFAHAREIGSGDTVTNAVNALGVVAMRSGRLDDAEALFGEAIAAGPINPQAYNNRGSLRARRGDYAGALEDHEFAVRQFPGFRDGWFNLGLEQLRAGDADAALAALDRAITLDNRFARAHYLRACVLLGQARYAEGWAGFLWRFAAQFPTLAYCPDPRSPDKSLPVPDPADYRDLAGQRVVLLPEPDPADSLAFLRFVPLLAARGAQVLVIPSEPLADFMGSCTEFALFDGTFRDDDRLLPIGDVPFALGLGAADEIPPPASFAVRSMVVAQTAQQQVSALGEGPVLAVAWRRPPRPAEATPALSDAVAAWAGAAVCLEGEVSDEELAGLPATASGPLARMGIAQPLLGGQLAVLAAADAYAGPAGVLSELALGAGVACHHVDAEPTDWRWTATNRAVWAGEAGEPLRS